MPGPPVDAKFQFFSVVDSDGSSTRDLSAFITSVDGLPGTNELADVTTVGDSGHSFIRTLFNTAFTVEGIYDHTAVSGPDVVLSNLLGMTSATTFRYGPTGSSSGQTPPNRLNSGSVWCRDYTVAGRVGTAVSFRSSFQVDGVVAIGTFT